MHRADFDIELSSIKSHATDPNGITARGHADVESETHTLRPVESQNDISDEDRHNSRTPSKAGISHSEHSSQCNLVLPTAHTYSFEDDIFRSSLNTAGSGLVTAFYLFIVYGYLLRPSVNDIIPYYPVDARGVFYGWLILSVFVLDWAKFGLAGFEASALVKPALAPKTALQLFWHADRARGSVSGWWKAVTAFCGDFGHPSSKRREYRAPRRPAMLWWYLSLSSFILFAAIPLAGLSMDPKEALELSQRKILIPGPNQTTSEMRSSNGVAEVANSRWRQGNPTTPRETPSFTLPQGTNNVSERIHGKAWGLLTNMTCSVVHPYHDLELLKVRAINNWTVPRWGASSASYDAFPNNNYSSALPLAGSLELVMWQVYIAPSTADATFANLSSHPLVVSSTWPYDNTTYLGYAIRCSVNSTVGFANLDAATRSYPNFAQNASVKDYPLLPPDVNQRPGLKAIQSLVYGSFTTLVFDYAGPPVCQLGTSATCNPWYGANAATGGGPLVLPVAGRPCINNFQYPTLSPEWMKLAMYKLFGEAAIAVMAAGPGDWTGELHGLDATNDMVPGRVLWQVVVGLLIVWTVITVLPNC